MNIADQLRAFRLKELPKVYPPGASAPVDECATCYGPAGRSVGRHTGREFVMPIGCGHPAYPVEDGPTQYEPNAETARAIAGLIAESTAAREAKKAKPTKP